MPLLLKKKKSGRKHLEDSQVPYNKSDYSETRGRRAFGAVVVCYISQSVENQTSFQGVIRICFTITCTQHVFFLIVLEICRVNSLQPRTTLISMFLV